MHHCYQPFASRSKHGADRGVALVVARRRRAEFGVQASDLCVHGVLFVNLEVADHQQKSMSLRQLWDCTMHIVGALRSLNMFLESLYAL